MEDLNGLLAPGLLTVPQDPPLSILLDTVL